MALDKRKELETISKKLAELYPQTACFLHFNKDYELLIAVILSAQSLDSSVNRVTPVLFKNYPSLEKLSKADPMDVQNIIKTVGLSKTKSRNIVKTSAILHEKYNDKLPIDRDELQTLPGVGYKTSGVVLAELYHHPIIPVDTHIFRVINRLGTVKENSADKMSKILTDIYPLKDHIEFHRRVILLGRNICHPKNPSCSDCPLKEHCEYYLKEQKTKNTKEGK